MAKYKVGDKVRIVSERPESHAFVDDMVRFLGKSFTVAKVDEANGNTYYFFKGAHPEDLIVRALYAMCGSPGYFFVEDWISGPVDEATEKPITVHIRFCGNLTVAELIKDGKVVKVENARCNPKDTYSRAEGARVAVERLFEKKAMPKPGDKFVVVVDHGKSGHFFKAGDVAVLRSVWEDGRLELVDKKGLHQALYRNEVRPCKETAK